MNKPLKLLADVKYGKSPTDVRTDHSYIPIYGTGGIVGSASRGLFQGDGVVVGRKGTLGKPIYVSGDYWVIDTAYAVAPFQGVDAKWLYYNLANYDLESLNEATGVPSINRDYLYRIEFVTLSYPEQRKIAKILSTVDNLIEKTQAMIGKYQSIKQGMMHDLFTRGVDENGHLRPSYEEAPHLYKESELGWISKEWEVSNLKDSLGLVIDNRGKTPPYSEDSIFELIETASISHMVKFPDYSRVTKYVDEHTYYEWFRGHPEKDDVLISTVGEYAGSTAYMETNRGTIAQNLIALRFVPSHSSLYIFYWTKTDGFRRQIHNVMMNAAQPSLKVPHLLASKFPVPKLQEQHVIANKIDSINNLLNSSVSEISKYVSLKAGLMQDLLTGKVRVKVDAKKCL